VSALRAIAVVALGVSGLAAIVSCAPAFRRARLAERLQPYLGALGPRRSSLLADRAPRAGTVLDVLAPTIEDLGGRLHRVLGDHGDLSERLGAADVECTPARFRAQQVTGALAGFVAGVALSVIVAAAGRAFSPVAALGAGVAFAVAGAMWRDRSLTRAVARRRASMTAEFPTFVDMVCLAVTAGESLRGALDLVASSGSGSLAREMRAVLRDARTGVGFVDALEVRARRLGLAPLERFVAAIAASQERGIPLAESLRAMAFDVREAEKRVVIEAAGRKQVSMLVPVVALILPVAIAFAFYPGLVAVRTLVR
jgi:tight adherence protein C